MLWLCDPDAQCTHIRDQHCLTESTQWCQISTGIKLAPMWCQGRQDAGLENHTSAGMALTHYPETSDEVKYGQVACITAKKVPICLASSGGWRFVQYGQTLTTAL